MRHSSLMSHIRRVSAPPSRYFWKGTWGSAMGTSQGSKAASLTTQQLIVEPTNRQATEEETID